MSGFWKVCSFLCINTRLGLLLHELLHQCSVAWRPSACGTAQPRVALIAAFRSSALLVLVSLIFLLTIPHRFLMGFRSGEFAGQSNTVTPWSLNQLLVPLAVRAGAKSSWKMKSADPGRWLRWLWTSENPVDQHQQMLLSGPKSSFHIKVKFACHLEIEVLESVMVLAAMSSAGVGPLGFLKSTVTFQKPDISV